MEQEQYYVGTTLKYCVTITAEGFSQDTDYYEIRIVCNNKVKTYTPVDDENYNIIEGEDNNYYIVVETEDFQSGLVKMIVVAHIVDEDLATGIDASHYIRKEIAVQDLCYLKKT